NQYTDPEHVLSIINSTITGNGTIGEDGYTETGGGLYVRGNFFMEGSTVSGNSAEDGGGLAFSAHAPDGQFLKLTDCTIEGNHALIDGGGIWALDTIADSMAYKCRINNNIADNQGGAGFFDKSFYSGPDDPQFDLLSCEVIGNQALRVAGITNSLNSGEMTLFNCLFAGNVSTAGPMAVNSEHGCQIGIQNCTLADNSGSEDSYAISIFDETWTIVNSIIWGNNGAGPLHADEVLTGTISYTIIDDPAFIGIGYNIIYQSPLFRPTPAYSVHPNSPAIDSGTLGADYVCLQNDDEIVCMGSLSSTGYELDTGMVDIGYHQEVQEPPATWIAFSYEAVPIYERLIMEANLYLMLYWLQNTPGAEPVIVATYRPGNVDTILAIMADYPGIESRIVKHVAEITRETKLQSLFRRTLPPAPQNLKQEILMTFERVRDVVISNPAYLANSPLFLDDLLAIEEFTAGHAAISQEPREQPIVRN
ncbi:right-handed parallel beta-helix repeat-containing protein, partial [Patescibacteria group bacterium]